MEASLVAWSCAILYCAALCHDIMIHRGSLQHDSLLVPPIPPHPVPPHRALPYSRMLLTFPSLARSLPILSLPLPPSLVTSVPLLNRSLLVPAHHHESAASRPAHLTYINTLTPQPQRARHSALTVRHERKISKRHCRSSTQRGQLKPRRRLITCWG